MISKTVRDELAKHELAEARRFIDQFNDHFKMALTMALPHAKGDVKHCKADDARWETKYQLELTCMRDPGTSRTVRHLLRARRPPRAGCARNQGQPRLVPRPFAAQS